MIQRFRFTVFRGGVIAAAFWFVTISAAADIHVCMECRELDCRTIEQAIQKADPYDTIIVHWEPGYPIMMEHLVIDKPLRIESRSEAGSLDDFNVHPLIALSDESHKEVIDVLVPNVEICGLNIMRTSVRTLRHHDQSVFDTQVGIRLRAPAVIRYCQITKCRTAILAEYSPGQTTGSTFDHCYLGQPTLTKWTENSAGHPGNWFGAVLIMTSCAESKSPVSDQFYDCSIVSNRYYGVVFSSVRRPTMKSCLVELNGDRPFREIHCELLPDRRMNWVD